MEEMAAIFKRFGDEQSTLLDQYERLSFEVQLNQAILGRSLSEQAAQVNPVVGLRRRGRDSGFHKVIRKLFRPILGKMGTGKDHDGSPKTKAKEHHPVFWKTFSRSLRV